MCNRCGCNSMPCCCPPSNPIFPFNGIYTQFARVPITPQDFFVMPTTQKTIIAAPGAGKMIVPLLTWAILDFNTTPYDDNMGFPPALIFYMGGNNPFTDAQILGLTNDATRFYTLSQNVFTPGIGINCVQDFVSTFDNQPLTIGTNLPPFNGDSTVYIYVMYSIITQ